MNPIVSIGAGLILSALRPEASVSTGSEIGQAGLRFADILKEGEAAAIKGVTGELPLQQAVEKVLEAERSLQAAIAVRDKIVSAYLEISRMQI
jgi:flagellar hook-basal body complex protein FliE